VNYQYNPYAAPQAAPPVAQGTSPYGVPQPWGVGEVISLAWERFKQNWAVLVFSYVVMFVITEIVAQVPAVLQGAGVLEPGTAAFDVVRYTDLVIGQLVGAFFQVGLTRIWLGSARGKSPSFGLLFTGGDRFIALFAMQLLMGIILILGFVALIVPGIILGLGLSLAQFYVVDVKMGPISAMKASWNATKGYKGDLFLLGLAGAGLGLLGMLMCLVGLFATVPIYFVATAAAYTRMSGIDAAPSAYADMQPAPAAQLQQPAGYGPPPGYGSPPGPPPGGGGYGGPPGYGPPPG
jgi:hypothetical protein